MIQRISNPAQEGLPLRLPKISNKNKRRSTSKRTVLLRVIAVKLLIFVTSLYVFGTRHILSISPVSSLSERGIIDDGVGVHPMLYQPISVDSSLEKSETAGRRRQLTSFSQKPRIIGYYYALTDSRSFVGTERLDPNRRMLDNTKSKILREEFMSKEDLKKQRHLLASDDYESGMPDTMKDQGEDCVAQYDWQERSFPTCNHLMEIDMTNFNHLPMFHENHYNNKHDLPLASSSLHSYVSFLADGYFRDVWKVENLLRNQGKEDEETFILKTMRYVHDYEGRHYDRHRRDAVAMEELTASKFIVDIYAACGNSGLFQFADGGTLINSILHNFDSNSVDDLKPWSPKEKLIIAYQTVSGVADLHNFAKEGVPSIAHTDITGDQFVYVEEEGVYKLNDFNRARFMGKNEKTNELCSYYVGNNSGKFRSPEEYEYTGQTEKVDIYSLGNILYGVLTGLGPFDEEHQKDAIKKVLAGERPHIPSHYRKSTDPFDQAILKVIELCWIHDPKKRASARELQTFIQSELERLGVEKDN